MSNEMIRKFLKVKINNPGLNIYQVAKKVRQEKRSESVKSKKL